MFWQSFSTIGSIKNNMSGPSVPAGPPAPHSLVIIGTGGPKTYGYTTDPTLLTWTFGNFDTINTITTPTSMCCGNVNSAPLWVVIGYSGTGATTTYYSTTSTNGTTWTTPSSNISSIFKSTGWCYSVSFGYDTNNNGIFLAIGAGNSSYNSPSVAISQDGITWKTGGNPFIYFGNNSYYGNGYWVAVGNTGNANTCVVYSSNISYAGNANITWSLTGNAFTNPAYSVIYTGQKWLIGTNTNSLWKSGNSLPTSTYTKLNGSPQWPQALMTNKGNIAVVGGQGLGKEYLYTNNIDTPEFNSGAAAGTAPTYIRQIEYIPSTTMWVAALAGTVNGNNSIAYSTTAQRLAGNAWTNIVIVNTNIPVCNGVAAAR